MKSLQRLGLAGMVALSVTLASCGPSHVPQVQTQAIADAQGQGEGAQKGEKGGFWKELNLTDAQKQQIRDLIKAWYEALDPTVKEAGEKLKAAIVAERVDATALTEALRADLAVKKEKAFASKEDLMVAIRGVLTKEQIAVIVNRLKQQKADDMYKTHRQMLSKKLELTFIQRSALAKFMIQMKDALAKHDPAIDPLAIKTKFWETGDKTALDPMAGIFDIFPVDAAVAFVKTLDRKQREKLAQCMHLGAPGGGEEKKTEGAVNDQSQEQTDQQQGQSNSEDLSALFGEDEHS